MELQMKEVQDSFIVLITKLTETESELYKLKKRASRATGQGTFKEPSAPAKGALSFQETVEDKETARHRAMLTAELKERQAKQRAEDERLSDAKIRDNPMKRVAAISSRGSPS